MSLQMTIHNVGHGQAVHAFTPNGQTIVVDLGSSAAFSPLEWLREITETIDLLVITHPHGDHIDDILNINNMGFKVRQFWRPRWIPKEEVYKQNQGSYIERLERYYALSDRYTGAIAQGNLVGDPAVSGGVSISQFSSKSCGTSNINNHSGVVAFAHHGVKVLVPGDNEPASWQTLLTQKNFKDFVNDVDVFMASHHGRASGYYPDLFSENKPSLCLVSDGRVQDTDARERYSYHAKGWEVINRGEQQKRTRNCLTTRNDGFVSLKIGQTPELRPYLEVEAN